MKIFLLISILFFYNGCEKTDTKDGLKPFAQDESSITPPQPRASGDIQPPASPELD